jgi:hypothetical protein
MTDNDLKNVCGQCGYSLEGLSDSGRCPECGNPFGGDVIVLWNTDDDRSRSKTMLIIHSIGVACTAFTLLTSSSWLARVAIVISLCLYTFAMWKLWPARNGSQLRISPEGVGNRAGFGNVTLLGWDLIDHLLLRRSEGGRYAFSVKLVRGRRFGIRFRCSRAEAMILAERIQRISSKGVELKH